MATKRFNDPIEPMDLANMRENGVRSLAVQCHQCRHETIINVDHLPAGAASVGCSHCQHADGDRPIFPAVLWQFRLSEPPDRVPMRSHGRAGQR
jgi:LSD1 subclass zinc finger protein